MKRFFVLFKEILVDYCQNSSVVGLIYICDKKYHFTERIFWLICVISSLVGSYVLIATYIETFAQNSISMVIENLHPMSTTNFPSLGVCEMGYTKEIYSALEDIINGLKTHEDMEYNYDVEDFMQRVIFHNLYNFGSIGSYCAQYIDDDESIKCPMTGYRAFAKKVRANCTTLFAECSWNGQMFDCCRYFHPVQTTLGTCYILNSVQAVEKYGPNWLDMKVGPQYGNGDLTINLTKSTSAFILNEEDVPHILLTTLQFSQIPEGYAGTIFLSMQNIINDELVIDTEVGARKCVFPIEDTGILYKRYSYSVCVTECLKKAQIKACNCSHYNMIVDGNLSIYKVVTADIIIKYYRSNYR
jgi:amiloride-sensitive sodium channel